MYIFSIKILNIKLSMLSKFSFKPNIVIVLVSKQDNVIPGNIYS